MSAPHGSGSTAVRQAPDGAPTAEPRLGLLPLLLLLAVAAVLQLLHVSEYSLVSVYDEAPHYAYVDELGDGSLPYYGQISSESTLEEITCRRWETFVGFGCETTGDTSPRDPDAYPARAAIYVAEHPPLYYAVGAVADRALTATPYVDSGFVAARTANLLWLLLGMTFTWLAAWRLGAGVLGRVAAVSLLWLNPQTLYFASVVNPDIAVMAAGAAAAAGLCDLATRGGGRVLTAVACLVAVASKTTGVVVPLLCGLMLAVLVVQAHGRGQLLARLRTATTTLLLLVVVTLPLYLLWSRWQGDRATFEGTFAVDRRVDEFPYGGVVRLANAFLLDDTLVGVHAVDGTPWTLTGQSLVALLLVVLAVACAATSGPRSARTAAAVTGTLGPLVGTAFFVVFVYFSRESYLPVAPRYLFPAMPFAAAAAAVVLGRGRGWPGAALTAGLAALAATYAVDVVRFE